MSARAVPLGAAPDAAEGVAPAPSGDMPRSPGAVRAAGSDSAHPPRRDAEHAASDDTSAATSSGAASTRGTAALRAIPVVVLPASPASIAAPTGPTGAALALLHEIDRLLARLASHGECAAIDLRSLPLAPADFDQLRGWLGEGAVTAHLAALGESEIAETGVAGVWWIVHRDAAGEVMAELIEVAPLPSILATPPEDLVDGRTRLRALLAHAQQPAAGAVAIAVDHLVA